MEMREAQVENGTHCLEKRKHQSFDLNLVIRQRKQSGS